MNLYIRSLVVSTLFAATLLARAQYVPTAMQDHWIITRDLTEKTNGCYDPEHRKSLVGIKLSISDHLIFWNGLTSTDIQPREQELSMFIFQARFGIKPKDLGLPSSSVPIVYIVPSVGIPVNALVTRDSNTLLLDVCNIWLEASRDPDTAKPPK